VIGRLAEAGRQIEPALMYVGHPEGDLGTAFVISRAHRLLATNAHVAEIMHELGSMIAVRNGSHLSYRVERVWYHPNYTRVKEEGTYVRASGRWVASRGVLTPDVAVLQLSADGPDLPQECRIAEDEVLHGLDSEPVGLLGFSGPRPPPGHPMAAAFRAGTVSLLTDFTTRWDRSRRWRMLDFTAGGAEGDSGGPVFLPDGRIIAIFAWCRARRHREGVRGGDSSVGVTIDCLWELLDHHGLEDYCPLPDHK
jgi:hypothetical protein